jgi:hypothetical protein
VINAAGSRTDEGPGQRWRRFSRADQRNTGSFAANADATEFRVLSDRATLRPTARRDRVNSDPRAAADREDDDRSQANADHE